jgi:hypothetical protein
MFEDLQYSIPESGETVSGGPPSTLTELPTVERVSEARLPTELGEFRVIGYRSLAAS